MTRRSPRSEGFINVDLEVGTRTRGDLDALVEAFDGELVELFRGRIGRLHRATFEAHAVRLVTPSATIHALADVIEALRGDARRAWQAAAVRDFDVGVDIARGQWISTWTIDADAVARVAKLGGRIVFTAYQEAAIRQTKTKRAR